MNYQGFGSTGSTGLREVLLKLKWPYEKLFGGDWDVESEWVLHLFAIDLHVPFAKKANKLQQLSW